MVVYWHFILNPKTLVSVKQLIFDDLHILVSLLGVFLKCYLFEFMFVLPALTESRVLCLCTFLENELNMFRLCVIY